MSTSFVPWRIVGGRVLAARFGAGSRQRLLGVELVEPDAPPEPDPAGEGRDPYRTPSPGGSPTTRWVEVLEPWDVDPDDRVGFVDVLQETVAQLAALAGPGPRVLHVFGAEGRVHAAVLEHLEGAPLDRVIAGLRERGERVPIPVALAIARELAGLWQRAGALTLYLEPGDVRLSPQGHVRARPELPGERARQVVGAAVAVLPAPLAYLAPEAIMSDGSTAGSGMYTLGLVLRELLTGEPPVRSSDSPWEMIQQILRQPLPPLQTQAPDVPLSVCTFVDRALARDEAARFASWPELVRCLAAVASTFDPVGPIELTAWLRSLPAALRADEDGPPPTIDELHGWWALPRSEWGPVPIPELPPPVPSPARREPFVDPRFVYLGRDQRPMLACGGLYVDARPVTEAEHERFAIATGLPSSDAARDEPRTLVTYEQAEAYARWAGKRLPTDDEWSAVVATLGAEALATGEVWEWTATPKRGGHVVRGGRWRDAWERPPEPENRSHETAMATDVGFRCVMDRER